MLLLDDRKDFQLLSKDYTFDFAFVHPSTMRTLRIGPADPLLLVRPADSLDMLCTAWPSTQLDLADVSLSKTYLNLNGVKLDSTNNILFARPDPSRCFKAANIDVDLLINNRELFDEQAETRLIESLLKDTYLNKHVLDGQSLFLNYMGKQLVFKITRVDARNESSSLADRFDKSLKLTNNIQLPTLYRIDTSTRITISRPHDEDSSPEAVPKVVGFKDVAGLDREIQLLKEFFIQPFEFADAYKKIGYFKRKIKLIRMKSIILL